MRRPAVCGAMAFGSGILAAFYTGMTAFFWIIAVTVAMIAFVAGMIYYESSFARRTALFLCMLMLGGLYFTVAESVRDPLVSMCGEKTEVRGIIKEISYKDNMYSIVVENEDSKVLVKYYSEERFLDGSKGKRILVSGEAELPQERRNPGCFDYRLYLRSCGIRIILRAETIQVTNDAPVRYLMYTGMIRDSFEEKLLELTDETSTGLIMAILFGDKTHMDDDVYNDFQRNGTAHVLAVSGLHTGILYACFVLLWKGKKGILFYTLTCMILFMYMSLADFSPSVVRASCMILLHSLAMITRNRYDMLSAAAVTFTIMLMVNPYQLFHTGFQLSFLAIASIAVIMPFINRFYQGVFLSAAAIQAGMMPYTAYLFNYVSAGALIANLPVIFLAGIILPLGLCSLIASFVQEELFEFLVTVLDLGCDLLIWINGLFYASGRTSFDVTSPPVWMMVIYYGVLFFGLSEMGQLMFIRKEKDKIKNAIVIICAAALLSAAAVHDPFKKSDIVFVDVGQGDCIHIRTSSGKNYLIDGGGSTDYDTGIKVVKPYLLKNGVNKIDIAFVTHLHEDHYGGIRSLAEDGMIDKVAVFEANRLIEEQLMEETSAELIYLHAGNRVRLDKDVSLEILAPEAQRMDQYQKMIEDNEDENKASLIMKIDYRGRTVLVTGDIDEDGESALIEQCREDLDCDIIKVPHHGSRYSSSENFVAAVSPLLAVFQVGKNNYGHPTIEAIARYEQAGSEVVRNDTDGAVGISVEKDGSLKVVRMIH